MSSVNAVTINSITTNLINILEGLEKYTFEKDLDDPKVNVWVQLNPLGSTEEINHGEGPMYIDQNYEIVAQKQIENKTDHRIRSAEIDWNIKEAITIDSLNVGDLEASLLVSYVEQQSDISAYRSSEGLMVTFSLLVRFRDLRT